MVRARHPHSGEADRREALTLLSRRAAARVCSADHEREIVGDFGGPLEAERALGRGAAGVVRLAETVARIAPLEQSERAIVTTENKKRGAVLVVDDEPLIGRVIESLLAHEHDVTCEPSAERALERLDRGERFDAILCDLMMPGMSGMDLFERVRGTDPAQAEKMIFLTGGAFTARARTFVDEPARPVIEKPFTAAELSSSVRKLIGS